MILTFTKTRQNIEIKDTPIPRQRQVDHGLTQLFLSIRIFNVVSLVDNINQMLGFCDTPEHLANAGSQLPTVTDVHPS